MAYIIEFEEGGYYSGTKTWMNFRAPSRENARVMHCRKDTAEFRKSKILAKTRIIEVACDCKLCRLFASGF